MKKRNFSMLLLCISLFLVAGCSAWRGTEKSAEGTERAAGMENMEEMERMDEGEALTIYFFHDTACGSCDGTAEFREIISEQLYPYEKARPYRLNVKNVFKSEE